MAPPVRPRERSCALYRFMSKKVCLTLVTARAAGEVAHIHRLSRAWYYRTVPDPGDGREAMWAELIAQPDRITYIAVSAGAAAGFISAIRLDTHQPTFELTALYVLPEHMNAGVGSRLYDQYDADRREDEDGVLEVWKGNQLATAFYSRRGWIPTGTTRPGPQDADYVTYRLPAAARGG